MILWGAKRATMASLGGGPRGRPEGGVGHAVPDHPKPLRGHHPVAEGEVPVVVGHGDHPVAEPPRQAFHEEGKPLPPHGHPLGEGPAVGGEDALHPQGPPRQAPQEARLGGVGVEEVGPHLPEEGHHLKEAEEVLRRAHGLDQVP